MNGSATPVGLNFQERVEEEPLKKARLLLAECSRIILNKGLNLLGIEALDEM